MLKFCHGGSGRSRQISVNPGSKAAQKGVREGDVISSINGQSTRNISNSDAHALLRNAGQTLHLGLNEECSGSPKRRLHRNIQDSKCESIKRSTVSKTTTATVPVNGAADSNCNFKISTKGDGHQGKQNGGLKENSSTPDSKGPRRRRRSTSLQPATSDVKEDSDAVGEDTARRRRRSRGANRRKRRGGGGESDVSGNEQKRASEDRDVSVTDTDTDVKKKGSRRNSHNRKSSSVDRIKSDAEEAGAVAPKKARRRRSRTEESKIRFAVNADTIGQTEEVDEKQKETVKTELPAPIVTDNVQTEVVPVVTVDKYQMEELVTVDEIQTQVAIAMDTYQIADEMQAEVAIATEVATSCDASSILNGGGLDERCIGVESSTWPQAKVESDVQSSEAAEVSTQLLNESAVDLKLLEASDVAEDGTSEKKEDERCLSQSAEAEEEHARVTAEVHRVEQHSTESETCVVGAEDNISPQCQNKSKAMLMSNDNNEIEVVDSTSERNYAVEREGAFFINIIECNDTGEVWEEVEEAEVFYDASDRCVFATEAKLSAEERELLDPSPVMEAAEEETLRRFIHSLNLADYSKEAVTARNGGAEELFATRRDKRRTSLETHRGGYSQQRGLEVIVEENSSDYSDGEARKTRGWQEAVFIPETNEVVFVNDDESSSSGQNSALFYSSQRLKEAGIDVFSEDMENALENAVRVELADTSDEDEGTWERQDGVEIVYLDEDSGVKQDDPGKRDSGDFSDGVYENVEFVNQRMTVVRKKDYRKSVIASDDTSALYENVVYVRRDIPETRKENACPSTETNSIDAEKIETVEVRIVDDTASVRETEKLPESTVTKENQNEADKIDTMKEIDDDAASEPENEKLPESTITKENGNEIEGADITNELLSVQEKEVSGYFISIEAIEKDAVDSRSKHEELDLESITPTNRSRRESSSSDAGSHGTAFYCPGGFSPVSSDADVSSVTDDVDNRTLRRRHFPKKQEMKKPAPLPVRTLKELCVERVVSLPCGGDILRVLGIESAAAGKCLGKPPLSASLPDIGGVDHQPKPDPPQSLAGSQWLGMPTKQDPNLFVCFSPSQRRSYHQGEDPTPEEADNLLDLHRKFIERRSYHESVPPPPPRTRHCSASQDSKIGEGRGCSRSRSSSRLLAILRAVSVDESPPPSSSSSSSVASSPPPLPPPPHAYAMLHQSNRRPSTICCTTYDDLHTATLITNGNERLKVHSLSDWLQLVRCGGSPPVRSACISSTQSSPGAKDPSPEHQTLKQQILERRFSLPEKQLQLIKTPVLPTSAREDERHEQQLKLLHQRQQERLRNQQLAPQEEKKQKQKFDPDIAVINNGRPAAESVVTGGEFFRQQMYNEYMHKVAERAERRRQKVIRLSSAAPRDHDASDALEAAVQLENEFMGKVRARMDKLGLKYDEESDGGQGGGGNQLPKHLQEFLVITEGGEDGVWSPSQKASPGSTELSFKDKEAQEQKKREGDDAPPVVWTPKSAGASPTSERKEFRPVNFESPKLQRKNRSATSTPTPAQPPSTQEQTTTTTFSSIFPPWQQSLSLQQQHSRDDSTVSVGSTIQSPTSEKSAASSTISSTIDRRLVQSQSAPASGLSALAAGGSASTKLPRAQNPTITLLQKAREGQLPRGALYLDHKMNSKEGDKAYISPNEVLYSVRKEYESDGDGDQRKKMVDLTPRKFEGIGPMTKDGIPIVLRSEVKDTNQAKWYKRMYDSLHRAGKDDNYVTIRYKPRRGHYPYIAPGGYLSEPEPALYDSDIGYSAKYATLDRRRIKNKENDFTTSTLPRSRYVPHPSSIKYATEVYKNQPGRIEDYEPGHSSISDKETKQWWDEVLDIFDGWLETHSPHHPNYCSSSDGIYQRQASAEPKTTPTNKPFMTYALKESGYESDSTLVFKRRDENLQSQLSPAEQKIAYKTIQKGGEVPLQGLRKLAPERPKEPVYGPVPPRSYSPRERAPPESPHRYVESEVTIHYRSPVRSEAKEALSEEELARRQAEAMRRIYQEERRRKYLQELQDMHSRRHTDNFTPSQKSPIPLNRYDDILDDVGNKGKSRDRTPEPKLVARALYNFVGQTSRELSFRRGDIIFVRRQIDKNWYEGEHNAMVGLFPFNYVEIIPYDGIRTIPKRPSEGQARAKFNFIAQTHLELSLVKGELVVLTRRVDDNWFEGRIGNRKGIFPVSYVEILSEPGEKPGTPTAPPSSKPITLPASHTVLMNGSGIKQSMGQHSYQPSSYFGPNKLTSSNPYATLPRQTLKQPLAPVNQTLHIDTHSEPVPYRALYNYRPQNEDELELCEGDTVYVMEKCDDGWYVGSSQRTGYFGTFPGNYVERI